MMVSPCINQQVVDEPCVFTDSCWQDDTSSEADSSGGSGHDETHPDDSDSEGDSMEDDDSTDDDLGDYQTLHGTRQRESKTGDEIHLHTAQVDNFTRLVEEEVRKQEVEGQLPDMYQYDSYWQECDYYEDHDEQPSPNHTITNPTVEPQR